MYLHNTIIACGKRLDCMVDLTALGDGTSIVIAKATKEGLVWRVGYKAIPNLSQVYSKSRWKSGNFGTPRCVVDGTLTSS